MRICSRLSTHKYSVKVKAVILLLCLAVTGFVFVIGLFVGASSVGISEGVAFLMGKEVDKTVHNIIFYIRLPRGLAALLCGACLALSGLLLQSALHNPLASAGTIGVNAGAGLMAVMSAVVFPNVFAAKPILAFMGACLAAFLVFVISKKAGSSKSAIILSGVAVGSLFSAGTDTITTFFPDSLMDKAAFFIGGFAHVQMDTIRLVVLLMAAGFLLAIFLSPHMNLLLLGDEIAASLGLHVELCRIAAILCGALLASCAVCIGGLLGFVGLIVPHAVRYAFGQDHLLLIPVTALLGASFVSICDIIARIIFAPFELPVGIILSLLGAPFFLILIVKRRRISL